MPRISTDNSPLSIFRDRKSNPGLCLHRRSMSDTISEFGHPPQGQKQLHAVTDSELAKPDVSEFNSAFFRKDENFAWYSNSHRQPVANRSSEAAEMKETAPRPQYHNLRMIKRYDEVAHYETHFLSPYDDCPLSVVKDSIRFPHFSLGYRPKQDLSPARPEMMPPDSTTPKIFVQETRYDVRQAYQRRSNETIASSVQSSREDLVKSCKHNHSGTNVWQCDCNEMENVWIRKVREKKRLEGQKSDGQRLEVQRSESQRADIQRAECQRTEGQRAEGQKVIRSDSQRGNRAESFNWLEGQKPPGWPENQRNLRIDNQCHPPQASYQNNIPLSAGYPNMQFTQPRMGSKGSLRYDEDYTHSKEQLSVRDNDMRTMTFYSDDDVFLGSDQRHHFQEKIISSPQGQYGIATPIKDPHMPTGSDVVEMKPREQCTSENPIAVTKDKGAVDTRPGENEGKKPLRSSLKSPSDGLRQKFRKKHITQKVVMSGDKKKSKAKDNVMVTSL